jgi:glycosyltransferase involved in cell wall biosynthesis
MQTHWVSYSIIVPCFNDARRLDARANLLQKFVRLNGRVEVIVVDDGSGGLDRKFLMEVCQKHNFRLLHHVSNRGKWAAIRTGALQSDRTHVVVCDADLSTAPWHTISAYERFCKPSDVMVGDRNAMETGIPIHRRAFGWVFNKCTQLILGGVFLKCRDTQCPGKVFPRYSGLVRSMEETGFAGDVEWILRYHQYGHKIVPVAVPYLNDRDSKVRPVKDGWRMLMALFRIRARWL